MKTNKTWNRLLQSTALIGVAAMATPAMAQDEGDTIVVTGTLIKRQDIQAPSPVTSVSAEELKVVNTVNTEDFLNTLPQAIPGFDATSNNPGDGVATANLRGLGAVRTLVLVEGRRFVPYDAGGVVDLNQIPAALIERTDVVTGGASALYGSDAMAGVVNFDLRDDFQGVELSSSFEVSEEGDGEIFQTSIIAGGDFADGRGNATFFAAYTDRQPVFQGDRDFSAVANNNARVGEDFDPFGSSGVPGTRFFETGIFPGVTPDFSGAALDDGDFAGGTCAGEGVGVVDPDNSLSFVDVNSNGEFDAMVDTAGMLSGDEACGGGFLFADDGTPIPWINAGANTTRYNYAPVNYLQLPQERYNLAAFANYQLFDNTELKLRGTFASNVVAQELAPTPIFDTFAVSLDSSALTPEAAAIFRSSIDATQASNDAALATAQAQLNFAQGLTAQELADAELDIADLTDAVTAAQDAITAFDASVDTDGDGIADTYNPYIGRRMLEVGPRNSNRDQQATQWSLETNTDLDNGMIWTNYAQFARTSGALSQTGNVSRAAFQAALDDGCDIFGPNRLSPACVEQVARTGIIRNAFEQTVLGTQISGDFFGVASPMASAPVAFAAGIEYREESGDFQPDSVLGPDVAGFNQSAPIKGRFDVLEGFAEFAVPLVQGMTGFDELSVNGAVRISDYSTVGTLETYQAGVAWAPVPDVTIKASFNRAARAPNLAELFQPVVNGFPQADDPCAAATDGTPRDGVEAICTREGVPASAFQTTALQPNSQIEGLFGGNADLDEEVADTFTVGIVAQPSAIPGLTVTLDYYDIEVEDVIGTIPANTVLQGCYIDDNADFCSFVSRSASGQIDFLSLNNQNLGVLTAKGVDLDMDYAFDPADFGMEGIGTFNIRFVGTYRIEDGFQATSNDPFLDCAGTHGGRFGECFTSEPKPEWKHTMFVTHNIGDLATTLRWRYLSGTDADDSIDPANGFEDYADFRGGEIDAFNYVDLSANYQLTESVNIAGGIQNLFDKEPPINGDSFSEQANTYPATYDTLGRSYFVSATFNF